MSDETQTRENRFLQKIYLHLRIPINVFLFSFLLLFVDTFVIERLWPMKLHLGHFELVSNAITERKFIISNFKNLRPRDILRFFIKINV